MYIKILGAAAGGGFPQWNCNGRMSAGVRAKKPGFQPRTQASLAISTDNKRWILLEASPDLREQIAKTPELWPDPEGPRRQSPLKAVVVTSADVDHIAGLLHLRESQPFTLYGSARVLAILHANPIFRVCHPALVPRVPLHLGQTTALFDHGDDLGIAIEAFAVPGKIALFLEGSSTPSGSSDREAGNTFGLRVEETAASAAAARNEEGDTLGLRVEETATGRFFFYLPGCAEVGAALVERLQGSSLLFFDGTLYTDDEMITQGLLSKTGQRMGHLAISGPQGSLAAWQGAGIQRKIYLHLNTSNPVLDDHSPERKIVEEAGWEVAYDGMEIQL